MVIIMRYRSESQPEVVQSCINKSRYIKCIMCVFSILLRLIVHYSSTIFNKKINNYLLFNKQHIYLMFDFYWFSHDSYYFVLF